MSDGAKKKSIWYRLYNGETSYDFVGKRRIWFAMSGALILAGLISLFTQGLNMGIDFEGGNAWVVNAPGVSVAEARESVGGLGVGEVKVQIQGENNVRVQTRHLPDQDQVRVSEALAGLAQVPIDQVSVNDVGPSWGKAVTSKARTALIVFLILITIYISLRFEYKMAIAAMSAVAHDILVTVGVYSISRFEVTPATVTAFLTILGYSLYDTIVVFDKVEENAKGLSASGRMTYSDTVNLSMNQVLMRSLNTSLVAILPIVSILVVGAGFMGAVALKDFGLALLIGLLTGAYSSIYIASPILAMLKEREPRYAAIRQRAVTKGAVGPLTPAAAAAASGGGGRARAAVGDEANGDGDGADVLVPSGERSPTSSSPRPKSPSGGARPRPHGAPRPRKKGKKR